MLLGTLQTKHITISKCPQLIKEEIGRYSQKHQVRQKIRQNLKPHIKKYFSIVNTK